MVCWEELGQGEAVDLSQQLATGAPWLPAHFLVQFVCPVCRLQHRAQPSATLFSRAQFSRMLFCLLLLCRRRAKRDAGASPRAGFRGERAR